MEVLEWRRRATMRRVAKLMDPVHRGRDSCSKALISQSTTHSSVPFPARIRSHSPTAHRVMANVLGSSLSPSNAETAEATAFGMSISESSQG